MTIRLDVEHVLGKVGDAGWVMISYEHKCYEYYNRLKSTLRLMMYTLENLEMKLEMARYVMNEHYCGF